MICPWQGVIPAVTTQFDQGQRLDVESTQRVLDRLVTEGVNGVMLMGSVGENTSLEADERRRICDAAREAIAGRVPILCGVAEYTTDQAIRTAHRIEKSGLDGIMLLPGMVYRASPREIATHYVSVAAATGLPIMIYNNPIVYGTDITVDILSELAAVPNLVAVKDPSRQTGRITDMINAFGDRFTLFCGWDDLLLECVTLGATGWISGMSNVFPRECVAMFDAALSGDLEMARRIYRWFMPLLGLDSLPTFVQAIKLAEQVRGRGREYVRAPRLLLEGAERAAVVAAVERAEQILDVHGKDLVRGRADARMEISA